MTPIEHINRAQDELTTLIEGYVRAEVEKLFRRHRNLVQFNDIMGLVWFEDNKGNSFYLDDYRTFKHLSDLYGTLNGGCLGITIDRF